MYITPSLSNSHQTTITSIQKFLWDRAWTEQFIAVTTVLTHSSTLRSQRGLLLFRGSAVRASAVSAVLRLVLPGLSPERNLNSCLLGVFVVVVVVA